MAEQQINREAEKNSNTNLFHSPDSAVVKMKKMKIFNTLVSSPLLSCEICSIRFDAVERE